MFRDYKDGIPLDLVGHRSHIISLNDGGGEAIFPMLKDKSDHTYIFSDHLPKKRTEFYRRRRPHFVMAKGHSIPKSHMSLFVVGDRHSCLWSEATRFNESQILAAAGTDCHTIHTETSV